MNKFYESMFNQKLHSPYEAKLINYTYPILTGARFGPKQEDVLEATRQGFLEGTGFVTSYLENEYIKKKAEDKAIIEEFGNPIPMTADELLNKVFNRSNLGEKGPEVTSYRPSTTSSRHISPEQIRKSYTVSSPKQKQRAPSPELWGTSTLISTLPSSPDPWGKNTTISTPPSSPNPWGKGTTITDLWGKGTTPISTAPLEPLGPEFAISGTTRKQLEKEFIGLNPEFENLLKGKAEEIVKSKTEKKTIPKADEQTIKEGNKFLKKSEERKTQQIIKEIQQPHKTLKSTKKLMKELKEIAPVKPQTEEQPVNLPTKAQPVKPQTEAQPVKPPTEEQPVNLPTEAQQEEDISKRLEEKEKKVPKQEPIESAPTLIKKSPIKLQQQKTEIENYLKSRLSKKFTSKQLKTLNNGLGDEKIVPLIDSAKKILGDILGNYFNKANELTQKRIMFYYFKNQLPGLQGPFAKEGSKEKLISKPEPDIEKKELEIITEQQPGQQNIIDFINKNIVSSPSEKEENEIDSKINKYSENKINNARENLLSALGQFYDDASVYSKKQITLLYLEGKLKDLEPKPEPKSKKK